MKLSLPSSSPPSSSSSQRYPTQTPKPGISNSAFFDATAYNFGIALPVNATGDFIWLVTGKGTGWWGISLGGPMMNKLLIAAWTNEKTPIASFRETPRPGSPPEVTGTFSYLPIANSTYTNTTHWSLAFLCKACIKTAGTNFSRTAATNMLGWAYWRRIAV